MRTQYANRTIVQQATRLDKSRGPASGLGGGDRISNVNYGLVSAGIVTFGNAASMPADVYT